MLKMCFRWLLEIAAISKAQFRSVTLNNGRYPTNRGKSTWKNYYITAFLTLFSTQFYALKSTANIVGTTLRINVYSSRTDYAYSKCISQLIFCVFNNTTQEHDRENVL